MLYMLDTDICAYISRRNSPQVSARFQACPEGQMAVSVVTYGELRVGAEKSNRRNAALSELDLFTLAVPVLPMDRKVAEIYAKIRLDLQQRGQIIGANDLWIAAHCMQLGLTLVTNNEREFSRIPNLTIENWTH
jgi:tRNA(fMet)-specific endonuclease VapC